MTPGNLNFVLSDEDTEVREHDIFDGGDVQPSTDQVEQEDAVIVDSDAVVNPQAVMIEAVNTPVAEVAVERFLGAQDLA